MSGNCCHLFPSPFECLPVACVCNIFVYNLSVIFSRSCPLGSAWFIFLSPKSRASSCIGDIQLSEARSTFVCRQLFHFFLVRCREWFRFAKHLSFVTFFCHYSSTLLFRWRFSKRYLSRAIRISASCVAHHSNDSDWFPLELRSQNLVPRRPFWTTLSLRGGDRFFVTVGVVIRVQGITYTHWIGIMHTRDKFAFTRWSRCTRFGTRYCIFMGVMW